LLARIRREALEDAVGRAEDNLFERLVREQARLGLNPIGVEHIAHARADDPVEFVRLGGHSASSSVDLGILTLTNVPEGRFDNILEPTMIELSQEGQCQSSRALECEAAILESATAYADGIRSRKDEVTILEITVDELITV
jgi:hypothetical protein